MARDQAPLIVHVVHRLAIGGLENGLVNLINHIPEHRFRHAIICMDDYSSFSDRIRRSDVELIAIRKKPGTDIRAFWRLFLELKRLNPAILHTRNMPSLDALLPAMFARVPYRIHSEHGRDMDDLDGSNRKLQLIRRLHRPMVSQYVALSRDLENYLIEKIRVKPEKLAQIYNGVDTSIFRLPRPSADPDIHESSITIGTVGRLQAVKDPLNLVEAFIILLRRSPELRNRLRLVIVGDGALRQDVAARLHSAQIEESVSLAGSQDNIHEVLQSFDIFAQPSRAEGISNTILEAMASGLPIVATDVGGTAELVVEGDTGLLVPPADPEALCDALEKYVKHEAQRAIHGRAGRKRVEKLFSINSMVEKYTGLYEKGLVKPRV